MVLVTFSHNAVVNMLLIFGLMFAAMSLRPLSYSVFIALLTPVIVLLFSAVGIGGWEIGVQRIVDSLIGGALAFAGSYLFFPSWEKQQLPAQLAQTIQANLAYFQVTVSQCLPTDYSLSANTLPTGTLDTNTLDTNTLADSETEAEVAATSLARLRHQASLENANAEASAQRLFGEPRHIRGEIEPVMTLILYVRVLFNAVTALGEHSQDFAQDFSRDFGQNFSQDFRAKPKTGSVETDRLTQVEQLLAATEHALLNLAIALNSQQPLQSLPPLADYLATICDRVEELHTARLLEMKDKVSSSATATTPTLQAIQIQTPIATELSRIVRAVTVMHSAASRIHHIAS